MISRATRPSNPAHSKLATPTEAIRAVHDHVNAATINCSYFVRLGFSELGFPNDPATQRAALEATVDELQQAIRIMRSTRWPTVKLAGKP